MIRPPVRAHLFTHLATVLGGLVLVTVFGACATSSALVSEDAQLAELDVHSFADPAIARVTHVSLDLSADFTAKRLTGTAELTYEAARDAREIVLDTRKLEIMDVTSPAGDRLRFDLGAEDPTLGRPLRVTLPRRGNQIVIRYRTSTDADAVQWLEPQQTTSGEHPFLFTQGQAIHTRTWIPTQDSPGIRQTYDATIHVPPGLTALMSAEMLTPGGVSGDVGQSFRFRLDDPIPPYLIALAIGELEFRALSPRTGVWAEPAVIDDAAFEFADMPEMMRIAEELYGAYRWDRFDVLVLPPSFPYGGMENPRLTFATPTLLAGDRSLTNVIAHELAHSWSGNLVTNATWDDFWLNEGFTTYIEYRIMEAVFGEEYLAMIEHLERQKLLREIDRVGHEHPDTHLKLDLSNRGPEDSQASVAYEKGAAFLRTIEGVVGRDRFDAFLREYFDEFAFRPMTSERFLAYMDERLLNDSPDQRERINPGRWVYGPGLPDNAPTINSDALTSVERHAGAFTEEGRLPRDAASDWTTHEWRHFLLSIPETLSVDQMEALDEAFDLTDTRNSEVRFLWLRHAIRAGYEPAGPAIEAFLVGQGRLKFVTPLYRELIRSPWGHERAVEIFERARPGYHPITERAIHAIVNT